jgi:hypothetical protein
MLDAVRRTLSPTGSGRFVFIHFVLFGNANPGVNRRRGKS